MWVMLHCDSDKPDTIEDGLFSRGNKQNNMHQHSRISQYIQTLVLF